MIITAWDAIVNAAASGLLALFGIWLWTLKPRTRLTRMLGLFAVAHGVVYVFENLIAFNASSPLGVFMTLGWAAAAYGLLATAREMLRSLGARGQQLWRLAVAGVGLLVALILVLGMVLVIRLDAPFYPLRFVGVAAHTTFILASSILPLVFAWLHRHPPHGQEERVRREAPLLSAALLLWPGLWVGSIGLVASLSLEGAGWIQRVNAVAVLVLILGTGVVWLTNIGRSPRQGRAARNVAWLAFGLVLFGAIDRLVLRESFGYSGAGGPFFGVARLATIGILSYAILKHEVLGLDVRFRWGISRTTVAAVFVAVFFVASEGAQILFGQGNEWVGLFAAGALVFAIAPLQRAAERLAEKAIPAAPAEAAAPAQAEAAYLAALRAAMRDGSLSRREEHHLADVAEHLGIGPKRALELRDDIERLPGGTA